MGKGSDRRPPGGAPAGRPASAPEPPDRALIRALARDLAQGVGAAATVVWTPDPRTGDLAPVAWWAKKRHRALLAAHPDASPAGGPAERAFRGGVAAPGSLVADDPRALGLAAAGCAQAVGLPLEADGARVGSVELIGRELRRFGPTTRAFVDEMCDRIAQALSDAPDSPLPDWREVALDAAGAAVMVHDWHGDGRVVSCSPGIAALAGISAQEAIGATAPELLGLNPNDPDLARLRDGLRRGRSGHALLEARRADGTPWWCDLRVAPIRDEAGGIAAAVSVVSDVTARERAMRRLAEAEQRYRGLVERIPLVTYVCDFDEIATVRWLSPQAEELTGYRPEEFYADQDLWSSLIHPDDRAAYQAAIDRQLADGGAFDCTYRMRARDGSIRWVIDRDEAQTPVPGVPRQQLGVVVDITELRETRSRLEDSEEFHRTVLGVLSEGVIVQEPNGRIVSANAAAARVAGAAGPDEMVGTLTGDWLSAPAQVTLAANDATPRRIALRERRTVGEEITFRRRSDDTTLRLALVYEPLVGPDGDVTGTVLTATDVTREREAERALRTEHDRATRYLRLAGAVIIALDHGGVVTMANPAACEALGRPERDVVGRPWAQFLATEPAIDPALAPAGPLRPGAESKVVRPDGAVRIIAWQHAADQDAAVHPEGILLSGLDVTERREAEERIEWLAYHDSLTGLPNRAALSDALEASLRQAADAGRGVALLYCDLDGFKQVNDSLGHEGGDLVLQAIAHRLRAACRAGELVARPGGDEFLILLRDLDPANAGETARTAAARIASALSEPVGVSGRTVALAVSVGAAVYPDDAQGAPEMLKQADAAMYVAKGQAAERATPPPPRTEAAPRPPVSQSRDAARLLRAALDEKRFVLHWQPVVSLEDGRTVGLEALVRWDDPARGLLAPEEFLAFAEQTSLIVPLGEWALEAAVAQAAAWTRQGSTADWYVNVSARQLEQPEFADSALETIGRGGLLPSRFTIEIAESALDTNGSAAAAQARATVAALSGAGVRIAIDDFGAGESSMQQLRDLPIDALKIDGSLLKGIPEDRNARTVFRGVLSLAEALGLDTVAEGVETEEQRQFLSHAGCRLAQGFRFARPAPADAVDTGHHGAAPAGREPPPGPNGAPARGDAPSGPDSR